MLTTTAVALMLVTVPWMRIGAPVELHLASHRPGHVLQDRRDELRGGMRLKLQGTRPRPKFEPRSRVKPIGQPVSRRQAPLAIPPTVRRSSAPPRPVLNEGLAACRARYRSFDAARGTYRTHAGAIRRCPYLP